MIPPQPAQNPNEFKFENMTRDQLKRIQKSMKKPQFMGLLNEYMIQISDPKNRQQYDEYLRQMQRQGQLPKNMKLVQLTPHFCIRTTIVSEKNKKHNMKFFINFCSTQYLDQPVCEPSLNQEGKTAFGWKVPNSMGKIRYDQDKNGNPCQVADVAFNHKAYEIVEAENNLPFRKNQFKSMIIAIGLECAQKQLGQRKQTLSKDYDILKSLKCKGGKPALLPLRYIKGKAYNKGQGPQQIAIQRDTQGRQTKLQKQINDLKQKSEVQKKNQEKKTQQDEMEQQLQDKKALIQDLQVGIQQPKYSSIYTHPIDYSQFLQDPSYAKTSKVPSHFTVQFKLPRVEGMQEIGGDALNVNENRVVLKIGEKYFIDLPFETFKLKYKLLTEKIKAKFDKKKKSLRLIFPIDQSIKYYQEQKKIEIKPAEDQLQQQNKPQLVENETWKHKILQVNDPNVDLKIIEQNELKQQVVEAPQKKLIQQIDEDDYPQQAKQMNQTGNEGSNEPSTFQQALDQQKNHAFSLRKYYQTQPQQKVSQIITQKTQLKQKPNSLTYVFQQTSDKVVLVIKMLNYKRQQVKVVYDELQNNNFFIQWNQNQSQNQQLSKIHVLNFKINELQLKGLKRIEIVYRINFLAIFLHKSTTNKFWQKQSITTLELADSQQLNGYENFKAKRNLIQQTNNQRAEVFAKIKEQQMIQKQRQNKQISKTIKTVQKSQNIQSTSSNIQNEVSKKIYTVDNQIQQQSNNKQQNLKLQGQYFNFNNLPPQFIHFDIKFIQAMD